MRSFCSLVVALLAGNLAVGQATPFQPVTARFEKFVADGDLSGAVLLVGTKDKTVYEAAVGKRDLAAGAAMTPDTLFRIASMTKPVTALAVMLLADEGKLSADDAVEKHLPEFRAQWLVASREQDALTLKRPARPITLRDLLTHTSGVAAYPAGLADVYLKRNRTLSETTVAVSQLPLQFEPGTKWSYSNSGIDTLGRVVEVVSGTSFEAFVQKRILDPLGMADTTFYPTADRKKRVAVLYRKQDGKLAPADGLLALPARPKHPIPAGGLYSTAGDLAKLYRFMLNGGEADGKRLLSLKSHEAMTKTQTGDIPTGFVGGMSFGFGWAVVKEPKGVTETLAAGSYGHGGAFGTQGWIDPAAGRFFVLLIQRTDIVNGDASTYRAEFQKLAVEAMTKK